VWLLVVVSVAASLGYTAWRLIGASDGGLVPFYADAWRPDGVAVQQLDATTNGLATGDVVVAIAGRPLGEWVDGAFDPTLDRSRLTEGAPVPYTVLHDGQLRVIDVTYARHDVSQLLIDNWSNILLAVVMLGVGLYVLVRRPELSASVALVVLGCGMAGSILPWLLGIQPSDIALGWPFLLYLLTSSAIYMLLWSGAIHLPLAMLGHPSRRALTLAYVLPLGGYAVILAVARMLTPTPTAWLGTWAFAQMAIVIPCVVAGLWLAVRGYRAAPAIVRRQVRWAVSGAAVATIIGLALLFVPQLITGRPLVSWSMVGLFALPAPIGVAVGILRYRMFDIDVVVNRTLVYGGMTLAVVALYVIAVVVLGALLPFGQGLPVSLLATGLAAVAALPMRDLLQRGVNRLMYGDRDEPYRALSRLGQRLEGSLDPIEAPGVIVRTVAESLHVPWVGLQIRPIEGVGRLVEHGTRPSGQAITIPLVYNAEVVGDLLVAPRSPAEPLSAADRQLLEAIARQSGAAIHAIALTSELIESRERLVAAREEERRRIRHDLHDGLGPTLAAIGMRAELAADLAAKDPAKAAAVLAEVNGQIGTALAEIRRLVDGLRPPSLDELGLVGALRAEADRLGSPPAFDVVADMALPRLPAAVEVAAYRIGVEAMTNALRHAAARHCRVEISVGPAAASAEQALRLEIADDGAGVRGGLRPGIGMTSMRQRAAEVGASLELGRGEAGGLLVRAVLPLTSST
jgi:signal transduction histidine kinase